MVERLEMQYGGFVECARRQAYGRLNLHLHRSWSDSQRLGRWDIGQEIGYELVLEQAAHHYIEAAFFLPLVRSEMAHHGLVHLPFTLCMGESVPDGGVIDVRLGFEGGYPREELGVGGVRGGDGRQCGAESVETGEKAGLVGLEIGEGGVICC